MIVGAWSYIYHIEPTNQDLDKLGLEFLKVHSKAMVELYESENSNVLSYIFPPGSTMFFDSKGSALIKEIHKHSVDDLFAKLGDGGHSKKNKRKKFNWHSPDLVWFVIEVLNSKIPISQEIKGDLLVGCPIIGKSGEKYAAVKRFPSRFFKRHMYFRRKVKHFFPYLLVVTALICFFLSRHLVHPVLEIQSVEQSFADGNLSARIGEKHAQRIDELGYLASSFNEMADKIETMVLSQRRLQSDISHELRSPLARMQVAIEILRNKFSGEKNKTLDRIALEASRMNELIGKILELSKVDKALANIDKRELNITEILKSIVKDANFEINGSGKEVIFNFDEEILVDADFELLTRAFENVIRNGVKHANSKVIVNQFADENSARYEISDDGSGVNETELAQIFEPFFRCQEARDRKTGGAGLGLAIAKRSVTRHSGKIWAENLPDSGLKVIIEIPLGLSH